MALILVFQAASKKSVMFFFTGVYKKIQKDFAENLYMVACELWFFFQVSELNKKLDKLSLKGSIHPCEEIKLIATANSNFHGLVPWRSIIVSLK